MLITTHYIEEAKTAANVAFMSAGTILRQSNPQMLLSEYHCDTLEEVFLKLCQNRIKQRNSTTTGDSAVSHESNDCNTIADNYSSNTIDYNINNNNNYHSDGNRRLDWKRVATMLWKYYILTLRRPLFLFLFYVLPVIVLTVMKFSIGQKPHGIPIAVYNGDLNPKLSQLYLDSIDPRYLKIYEYGDNQTAYQSVARGRNTLSVVFGQNFSDTFELRFTDLFEMSDEELDSSQIQLYADFSNSIIGNLVYNSLFKAFENFLKALGSKYGPNLYRSFAPIIVEEAVYGWVDLNLNVYISPGLMMALAHVLPMIISSFQIIYDRKNASMERVFVAGVRPIEFFLAHVIQNFLLIVTQVAVSMIVAFGILTNVQLGSYVEVYLMFFLQGIQGMCIGLLVSLLLYDEVSVGVSFSSISNFRVDLSCWFSIDLLFHNNR